MRATRTRRLLALVTLLLAVSVLACRKDRLRRPTSPAATRDAILLERLVEEVWAHRLERDPLLRVREGLPVERLEDLSFDRARRDFELARGVQQRLEAIDPSRLDAEDRLTHEVLAWETATELAGFGFFWHRSVLTPYSTPLRTLAQIFDAQPLADGDDVEAYLVLAARVPGFVDALREHAAAQMRRGIVVPRPALPAVIELVRSYARSPDRILDVSGERLAGLEPAVAAGLERRAGEVAEGGVRPALERLVAFLEGEYAQAAPEEVGAGRLTGGGGYYRYLTRLHTTLEISPEEVHRIGLERVAELEERMAEVRAELGFEGSAADFHRRLAADPERPPLPAEAIGERLVAATRAFEARLDDFFLHAPAAPYRVERLPAELEGALAYGYYEPPAAAEPAGVYYYNGAMDERTSPLGLSALSLHELLPGHHFQIARQLENAELPDFRRNAYPTAYVEGWGSYASSLGLEAGLYDDPYERYGYYALEIFLACRLVVDPGLNHLGWSLEEAREYLRRHTLETEEQIASEVLRYSTDLPGQALAYQIGQLELRRLRERAEERLGPRFDLPRFHEALVGSGALPLAVLKGHVERFLEREEAQSSTSTSSGR